MKTNHKLKPSDYYSMQGGTGGTHCRRCNELLNGKKIVMLYSNVVQGTWHTTPQPDDDGNLADWPEEFGTACAKAALAGK